MLSDSDYSAVLARVTKTAADITPAAAPQPNANDFAEPIRNMVASFSPFKVPGILSGKTPQIQLTRPVPTAPTPAPAPTAPTAPPELPTAGAPEVFSPDAAGQASAPPAPPAPPAPSAPSAPSAPPAQAPAASPALEKVKAEAIAKQKDAQEAAPEKSTATTPKKPDIIDRLKQNAAQALALAIDQLEKLKDTPLTQLMPKDKMVQTVTNVASANIETLNDAKAAGVTTDTFLGNIGERWGNLALPIGIALMFFGGSMGKLAGGLLALAGGANIYGRIKEMEQPYVRENLAKIQQLKARGIVPFSQQCFDELAKMGVPSNQLATMRDVQAGTLAGALDMMHGRVLREAEATVAKMFPGDANAIKAVHDGIVAKLRANMPQVPEGTETNYTGSPRGWMDSVIDTVTGQDSRYGPTNPAPAKAQ